MGGGDLHRPRKDAGRSRAHVEALSRHTRLAGGEVTRVPLNARFEHDLPRMHDAARRADLVYICNPNNPTATITPSALREFVAAVPAQTLILVDEAYHHYATSPAYPPRSILSRGIRT